MSTSSLDPASIEAALAGTVFAGKLHHFPTIDSTQTRALSDAAAGIESGHVYIADEQTAGRGRGGHTWHSEPDRGLYLTALVRPHLHSNDVLKLSLAAALAAQTALLRSTSLRIDLRWPNDLVVPSAGAPSRKLGGILTEAVSTADGALRHAAIGIGINLNQAEFPDDLQAVATSVRLATDQAVSRAAVAIALLQALHGELLQLDGSSIFQRFSSASSWVHGKRVTVAEDESSPGAASYTGLTAGLTDSGLLRVRDSSGRIRIVRHGGVREDNKLTT